MPGAWQRGLLALVLLSCTLAAQGAQSNLQLTSPTLTLGLDPASGALVHWQPATLDTTAAPIRDFVGPAGYLLRLQGRVAGRSLDDYQQDIGGWQLVRESAGQVELALPLAGMEATLHQRWTLDAERPWQASYHIWLDAAESLPVTADLSLEIGPGMGEVPATGLGAAQDLYSYTRGVMTTGQQVLSVQLPQDEQQHLQGTDAVDWLGLHTRYFAFIVAPRNFALAGWAFSMPETPRWHAADQVAFESVVRLNLPALAANGPAVTLNVFGGGKSYPVLKHAQPALDRLLYADLWSWMRGLILGLMYVLNAIHGVVGNWGVAILLLAGFVRLLIHPIAKRAMAAQKRFVALQEKIQPELREIKRNFKGGEQSELILQLYERHNTSPFAGLKPLFIVLLQIPIFIALYHLLGQHFELRDQPFLWMHSLAEPDQLFHLGFELPFFGSYFNLLPALMALTTLASIKLSPAPAADAAASLRQNFMLVLMTLGFFLLFYSFPSGMVLYWTAANILQVTHQKLTNLRAKGEGVNV